MEVTTNHELKKNSVRKNRIVLTDADLIQCFIHLCKVFELMEETELFHKMCTLAATRFNWSSRSFLFVKMKCDYYLQQDEVEKVLVLLNDIQQVSVVANHLSRCFEKLH